ncbi:hypothetical protein WDU94_001285 [Cyamophila willieti]
MGIRDMALSLVYRIPMLKSTVQTVTQKYDRIKRDHIFLHLILSTLEICFSLCVKLVSQIQTYDYREYLTQLNHYVYSFVAQYITPVLWSQLTEVYFLSKHFLLDVYHTLMNYVDQMMCRIRGYGTQQSAVNFDSTNMVTMIDLITRSLAELKLKESMTNSLLEVGGYEHEFHDTGVIVEHSSTSCHCDKHQHAHQVYTNNNNLDSIGYNPHQPMGSTNKDLEAMSTTSCSSADDNIIAATRCHSQIDTSVEYAKENKDSQTDNLEQVKDKETNTSYNKEANTTSEYISGHSYEQHSSSSSQVMAIPKDADKTQSNQEMADNNQQSQEMVNQFREEDGAQEEAVSELTWHKLYPSTQPLIPMMAEDKAYELAEALKEKRQDKTGRDAYEVDTVLVLLSQWNTIDAKSKHYAIDRANLLYMAICYGWSYALQKINPTTTAPIVTPPVTAQMNQVNQVNGDHVPVQRQYSNESHQGNGGAPQSKNLRKNIISRSHGSVYTNDTHPFNNFGYFQRGDYNNGYNYRRSFPPHMSQHYNRYNSGHFYPK